MEEPKIKLKCENNRLIVTEGDSVKVFVLDDRYSELFKYTLKAIGQLEGDDPDPPTPPSSGYKFTLLLTSGILESLSYSVTSGTYIPISSDEVGNKFNINYDGTLYENQEVKSLTVDFGGGDTKTLYYIGNLSAVAFRSEMGVTIPVEDRKQIEDDITLPFFISEALVGFFGGGVEHTIIVTRATDPSATYTAVLTPAPNGIFYIIPETYTDTIANLDIEDNKDQDISIGDTVYSGKWVYTEEQGVSGYHLRLNDYDTESNQPFKFWVDRQSNGEITAFVGLSIELDHKEVNLQKMLNSQPYTGTLEFTDYIDVTAYRDTQGLNSVRFVIKETTEEVKYIDVAVNPNGNVESNYVTLTDNPSNPIGEVLEPIHNLIVEVSDIGANDETCSITVKYRGATTTKTDIPVRRVVQEVLGG